MASSRGKPSELVIVSKTEVRERRPDLRVTKLEPEALSRARQHALTGEEHGRHFAQRPAQHEDALAGKMHDRASAAEKRRLRTRTRIPRATFTSNRQEAAGALNIAPQRYHRMSPGEQSAHQVRADEPRCPRDHDAHGLNLSLGERLGVDLPTCSCQCTAILVARINLPNALCPNR